MGRIWIPTTNIYLYLDECGVIWLMCVCIYLGTDRVFRGECARLRENVPYVKVHRYDQKHLYPKFNSYEDNGERSLKV